MRVIIKIGTSTLAHASGRLNIRRVEELCKVISDLKNSGYEIILVSSGAIGMGVGKLFLKEKPQDIPTKQAAAAVGQCELMYTYDRLFQKYHHTVAQILLTGADFKHDDRYHNFQNTLGRLLELEVLPIINENDTIATEEIKVGDNDTLSAMVAAVGFAVMAFGSFDLLTPQAQAEAGDAATFVSANWLISTYLVLTFAELLLSPMGISFVSKVAPPKLKGMMMGGWFVATAIGNILVGVGGFLWGGIPLWIVWSVFIVLCLLSAMFMFVMMKRLEKVAK